VEGKMYLHDETFVLPRGDICTITVVYSPFQNWSAENQYPSDKNKFRKQKDWEWYSQSYAL